MPDTKTTLTWHLKDEVSGPARGIGSALGGLVSPVGLATAGVGLLAGGLVMAAKAAAEEEINVKKLDAALVASIPGWDGNTEAIEATIEARENLAFTDDELRNSTALLVTATGDVTEAMELQQTAMDLARLKGVDLETATIAIAKASEGSTRELKALGLTVDDTATAQENLAAISAAAAGQAEAYAETTAGKWEVLQTKFGDVVEKVGSALLPILEDLLDFAINDLIPAIEDFAELVGPILTAAFKLVGDYIGWWVDNIIKPAIKFISDLITFVQDAIKFAQDLGLIITTLPTPAAATSRSAPLGGRFGRQFGGPVEAFGAYTVGEAGPETLVMGAASGFIIPDAPQRDITVHVPVYLDGQQIADVVDRRLGERPRSSSLWHS